MKNIHTQSIPADVLTQVLAKLNEVNVLIKPYTIVLTPDERHSILKKGDKSSSFVEKTFEFTKTNPEFIPTYMSAAEIEIDITDSNSLIGLVSVATQVYNALDDTMMVVGSEAYRDALAYYNNVQKAADMNVHGAKAVYEELKKRFPGNTRKSEETANTAASTATVTK
jgi:hypothetical protein